MDDPTTLLRWLPFLVLAVLGLIGGILLVAFRARPQAGLGPLGATGPDVDPASERPHAGAWNAYLYRGRLGGTIGGASGRFDVAGGELRFTPDDPADSAWTLPCRQIGVSTGTAVFGPPVTLVTPAGVLRCTVSRERINRFSRNTAKTLRETGYGREFADVLLRNGAHPASA